MRKPVKWYLNSWLASDQVELICLCWAHDLDIGGVIIGKYKRLTKKEATIYQVLDE